MTAPRIHVNVGEYTLDQYRAFLDFVNVGIADYCLFNGSAVRIAADREELILVPCRVGDLCGCLPVRKTLDDIIASFDEVPAEAVFDTSIALARLSQERPEDWQVFLASFRNERGCIELRLPMQPFKTSHGSRIWTVDWRPSDGWWINIRRADGVDGKGWKADELFLKLVSRQRVD